MAIFKCWNEDCAYEHGNECCCTDYIINIGNEFDFGCDSFFDYMETKEYKHPYWKACTETGTGKRCRVLSHGKKIILNGEVFYCEIKDIEQYKEGGITHGRTGFYCGYKQIIEHFDYFNQKFTTEPDVIIYPVGVIDHGKIHIKQEADDGTEA